MNIAQFAIKLRRALLDTDFSENELFQFQIKNTLFAGYFKLDQTTPQTVSGGQPIFGDLKVTNPIDGIIIGWTDAQDPGHKHSKLWASDGSPEAASADASGKITVLVGLKIPLPPIHADNATALGAGLVAGDLYRTGADPDFICVVH